MSESRMLQRLSTLPIFYPLGFDLFCLNKKFLVYNMVSRNIKVKYRRSALGLFWTLLAPLMMCAIYYFVFSVILKVQIPHYVVFIISGILPWTFFSQTVAENVEAITWHWSLIAKVPVPIQVFPYVGTLTNLVAFLMALPIILGAALISGIPIQLPVVLLPYYFLLLFLITYSFALTVATAYVFLRDLRHLITIILQIWFYSTPVLYHEDMIPESLRFVIWLNPVGNIFVGIHDVLIRGIWPSGLSLLNSTVWAIASVLIAVQIQKRYRKTVVELV